MTAILDVRGLTVRFGGFTAVSKVDFSVAAGERVALIGPNGAGKTTCFDALTGFLRPTEGRVFLDGADVTTLEPQDRAMRGLVRSFQISAVFPTLTARENVRAALQRRVGQVDAFWRSDHALAAFDGEANALLESSGLAGLASVPAGQLPYGRRRALELATTLAMDPKVMLLDEPMAGMTEEDIKRTTALIMRLAEGRTVVMVEHNLSAVAALCTRVIVLNRGEIIAAGDYARVAADPGVQRAYLGRRVV